MSFFKEYFHQKKKTLDKGLEKQKTFFSKLSKAVAGKSKLMMMF
jgi:hypothetical protein